MKILMFMGEGHGGTFQYAALLSNALSRKHHVTAITPLNSEKEFFDNSVKVMEFPMGDTLTNSVINTLMPNRMVKILKAIKKEVPNVLHFHHPYYPWTCLLLPWLSDYPIVTSLPEGKLHYGMDKRWEMLMARKIHIFFSDVIIVLCEHDKEFIASEAKNKETFIVPHGANVLFTRYAQLYLQERDFVLFFGGIAPFKGLQYLLKAFYLVKEKIPNAKLIIAGRGSLSNYHNLLFELSKNIKIDNQFISPEKAAEYFQRSKMVVLPYIEHDHPGVVPIAYSFGKPVIVTQPVGEIVDSGRTGLVVPAKDEIALAEAIITLLEDNAIRKRMGEHALTKANLELNWDRLADRVLEAYQKAIIKNDDRVSIRVNSLTMPLYIFI